MLQFSLLNKA